MESATDPRPVAWTPKVMGDSAMANTVHWGDVFGSHSSAIDFLREAQDRRASLLEVVQQVHRELYGDDPDYEPPSYPEFEDWADQIMDSAAWHLANDLAAQLDPLDTYEREFMFKQLTRYLRDILGIKIPIL